MEFWKVGNLVLTLLIVFTLAGCGSNNSTRISSSGWDAAKMIESANAGDAVVPQVAMDDSGNAVAVWFQSDGTRYSIWANQFSAATGAWGTAKPIETHSGGDALFPQIAMNASGDAVVVWFQYDGGVYSNICANRYTAASGTWGSAEYIEFNDAGHAAIPRVAIDASGNAIAVWYQSEGMQPPSIWSNRFTAFTGTWGTPTLVETDDAGYAVDPRIALDASGNAIAVWFQSDGTRYSIWTNRYTAATGSWGTATLLETDDTGNALYPQIAIDPSGNAMVIWYQYDGTRCNIQACRYDAVTGSWGAAVLVETDDAGNAEAPVIALDASGNATTVWHQSDGTRANIWSNRYNVATGSWGTPVLIETDNRGGAIRPQIAIDAKGNAVVAWSQDDGFMVNVYSSRFVALTGAWGTPTLLENDSRGPAFVHGIAIDRSGSAVVVWNQFDGPYYSIWSSTYR